MSIDIEINEPWIQGKVRCQNGHVYIDHGYWCAEKGRAEHKRIYIGKYDDIEKKFIPNKTFYRLRAEYMAEGDQKELYPDPSPLPQKSLLGETYVDYMNRRPGNKKDIDDPFIPSIDYLYTKDAVSFVCYHFVFCTCNCAEVLGAEEIHVRLNDLFGTICVDEGIKLLLCGCGAEYVHLVVSAPPDLSIPEIVRNIKSKANDALMCEFTSLSPLRTLWNNNYFVSTAINVSHETIRWYIEEQKKRL